MTIRTCMVVRCTGAPGVGGPGALAVVSLMVGSRPERWAGLRRAAEAVELAVAVGAWWGTGTLAALLATRGHGAVVACWFRSVFPRRGCARGRSGTRGGARGPAWREAGCRGCLKERQTTGGGLYRQGTASSWWWGALPQPRRGQSNGVKATWWAEALPCHILTNSNQYTQSYWHRYRLQQHNSAVPEPQRRIAVQRCPLPPRTIRDVPCGTCPCPGPCTCTPAEGSRRPLRLPTEPYACAAGSGTAAAWSAAPPAVLCRGEPYCEEEQRREACESLA